MIAHPEWLAVPRALGRELYHHDPRDRTYVQRLIDYAARNSELMEGLYASPAHRSGCGRSGSTWQPATTWMGSIMITSATPPRRSIYSRAALEQFRQWVEPRVAAPRYAELVAAARDDPYVLADALPDQS